MATPGKQITFRLRRCPDDSDRRTCAELLSVVFADIEPDGIRTRSLATNLDPWERPRTKVATLTFQITPNLLTDQQDQNEWIFPVEGLQEPLILDSHFLGLTPLNDVEDEAHELDCIAISGLASHPFGSWQPKGEDKSFMWIREALPRAIPMSRAILYGYDTTLLKSNSFQTIIDLGSSLINHLKANGWHSVGSKPLMFLAHSLGGIVLKEAFSTMANGDDQGQFILNRFIGGIFFGVPSDGMKTSHLNMMVRGQVNEHVIKDLSTGSEYLRDLDDRFSGLVLSRQMGLCWAYETKTSPTIERQENGSYTRSGPEEILVTKESATRCHYHLRTPVTFPINENHSDMVKFRQDDHNLHVVLSKIRGLCESHGLHSVKSHSKANWPNYSTYPLPGRLNEHRVEANRNMRWFFDPGLRKRIINDLIKSLEVPGRDNRLETIDDRFNRTFEWVFDEESLIAKWIKEGTGMFWIHGKPGSGKSTLMKFIFRSGQTWELLHRFSSEALQIKSAFFFYDRGTLLQRSFEGLLRSILCQILQENNSLAVLLADELLTKSFTTRFTTRFTVEGWTINTLENCIRFLLQQNSTKLELFFVFDALDEYDGQLEFICNTLKEMINTAANSPNTLKILFSSRPWDIFKRQFRHIPSIQLQDYTKNDIREYCIGFVESKGELISAALESITPVVIERANGVFLWVKLVMQELIAEATEGKRVEELSRILGAIPDDLRDYYAGIIQRTPGKFRWEAYAIFQIITNGRDVFELRDLVRIVACSRSSTYREARQSLISSLSLPNPMEAFLITVLAHWRPSKRIDQLFSKITRFITHDKLEQRKSQIITMTGGLIEFVRSSTSGIPASDMAQLAHQTVREFVNGSDFKRSVLGHQARTIYENGHTFLARYSLARGELLASAPAIFLHESTTGKSLQQFIDSVPEHLFHELPEAVSKRHPAWKDVGAIHQSSVKGPLGFAIYNNLQLYLKDTLQQKPKALEETKELLLSIMPNPDLISLGASPQEPFWVQLTLLRYILDNGYSLRQDPGAFQMIMLFLLEDVVYRNRALENEHKFLEAKAAVLICHGQPVSMLVNVPDPQSRPNTPRNCVQAIHIATTIELIDCLVERGVGINTADMVGNSALDHALACWDDVGVSRRTLTKRGILNDAEIHEALRRITHLINRGGTTNTTPRHVWELCIRDVEERGLDATAIRNHVACLLPIEET